MKVIGVIPARWGSKRFEGKVLASLSGKPLIQHVWERAKQSKILESVIIACDDKRVLDAAKGFGADAVMTKEEHPSGTDRIAEAVENLDADIIVNIQGDEPLIESQIIDDLANALLEDESSPMATVVKVIDDQSDLDNSNVVKAVIDNRGYALYFSRSRIPFTRETKRIADTRYYKHLGIYAYRKDFLLGYKDLPVSKLEQSEKLEQLRALEAGYKIKTVKTTLNTIGVDTPEELKKVEEILNNT